MQIKTERQLLNLLVDLDADRALGDVPYAAGAAMVEFVGHTLVNRAVNLDVDVIADFEDAEIGGEMGGTLAPERPSEEISRPRPEPVPRRHLFC